ncbi:hypothetical protein BN2497_10959 [Janthinobacterium sp. CG23_2]|nr:hypothetical protein BN2497_10959 [Janthinobacterium sp. CG23_2]CUU31877.1 hypothetical protein BN3177_10959 [Janthinobacterium sp. CG23_2]
MEVMRSPGQKIDKDYRVSFHNVGMARNFRLFFKKSEKSF